MPSWVIRGFFPHFEQSFAIGIGGAFGSEAVAMRPIILRFWSACYHFETKWPYLVFVPTLRAGFAALAIQLQESAEDLSSSDVANRLRDALNDKYRGSGTWCYFVDYFGDAESGDVIYSCDGDSHRASYEMTGTEGAAKCIIDFEGADDVVPRTI